MVSREVESILPSITDDGDVFRASRNECKYGVRPSRLSPMNDPTLWRASPALELIRFADKIGFPAAIVTDLQQELLSYVLLARVHVLKMSNETTGAAR
jgi:hypothetical protein